MDLSSHSDPFAIGWVDDGSQSGRLRTEDIVGNLVAISFGPADFQEAHTGGASVLHTATTGLGEGNNSSQLIQLNCPAETIGATNFGRIQFSVFGSRLGIRWSTNASTNPPDLCVMIDGVAYDVTLRPKTWDTYQDFTTYSSNNQWVCPDLLTDTEHQVEIIGIGTDSGTGALRTWYVFGFLASSKSGYQARRGNGAILGGTTGGVPMALTNAFVSMGYSTRNNMIAVAGILVSNSDTSAHTITIEYDGNTVHKRIVPANDGIEIRLPVPVNATASLFKLKADSNSVLTATIIQTY